MLGGSGPVAANVRVAIVTPVMSTMIGVAAAVVTFRFVDTRRAALEVEDAPGFVRTQAMAVLKQVASRYPYESATHETSLKSETAGIAREMRELLQSKVDAAGAEVASFELSDLSYAPEIARAMLVRQQA